MEITALLLSRLQFAFTISFHIIFPSFKICAGAAKGGKPRGPGRNQNVREIQALGVARDVHRPAAAVREQRVVLRGIALAEHAGVDLVLQMVLEEVENAFSRSATTTAVSRGPSLWRATRRCDRRRGSGTRSGSGSRLAYRPTSRSAWPPP
jgi:hypothetical protein